MQRFFLLSPSRMCGNDNDVMCNGEVHHCTPIGIFFNAIHKSSRCEEVKTTRTCLLMFNSRNYGELNAGMKNLKRCSILFQCHFYVFSHFSANTRASYFFFHLITIITIVLKITGFLQTETVKGTFEFVEKSNFQSAEKKKHVERSRGVWTAKCATSMAEPVELQRKNKIKRTQALRETR